MNNKLGIKKLKVNVTALAVAGFLATLLVGYWAQARVSELSLAYRTQIIAKIMYENSEIKKSECEIPFADDINELRTRGVKTDGVEEVYLVKPTTLKRCDAAKAKIEGNNVVASHTGSIKVPTDYITKNLF